MSLRADGAPGAVVRLTTPLEVVYPALGGTVRDRGSGKRRPFVRFYACEQDVSHDSPDAALPEAVRMASLTPARLLGLDDRKGSLEAGKDATVELRVEDL